MQGCAALPIQTSRCTEFPAQTEFQGKWLGEGVGEARATTELLLQCTQKRPVIHGHQCVGFFPVAQ